MGRHRFVFTALSIFLALWLWNCSDGGGVTPEDGDGSEDGDVLVDGDGCTFDSECEPGFLCCIGNCILPGDCPCSDQDACMYDQECFSPSYCTDSCSCSGTDGDDPTDGDGESDGDTDGPPDQECNCTDDPCITTDTELNFGPAIYDRKTEKVLHIRNDGGSLLQIFSIEFNPQTSPDYTWGTEDGNSPTFGGRVVNIEPGDVKEYDVWLTPSGPEKDVGFIDIIDNDVCHNGGKQSVPITSEYKGETTLQYIPDPCYFDFGKVEVGGEPSEKSVKMTSFRPPEDTDGNKLLSIGPMQFAPDSQVDFYLPASLNPAKVNYLAYNNDMSFIVYFKPISEGMKSVNLTIHHDADHFTEGQRPLECTFTGTGVVPCLTIEPNPIDFGKVTVGQQASIIVTLRSTCGGTVRMDGIEWSNGQAADFEIFDPGDAAHAVIPSNEKSTLRINYLPMDMGSDVAFLLFHSNSYDKNTQMPQPTIQVTVQGLGSHSIVDVDPESINFGSVLIGDMATETITVTNNGGGELDLLAITFDTNPAFSLDPIDQNRLPLTLGYLGEATFNVNYEPTQQIPGHQDEGELTIHTNNNSQPNYGVPLFGTPVWPACEFSIVEPEYANFVDAIDFGEVNLESTKTVHLRISNEGGYQCVVHSMEFGANTSSEFSFFPQLLPAITPGNYTDVTVSYAPSGYPGDDDGSIIIQTNDLREDNAYFEIKLDGLGVNPTIFITPLSSQAEPYDFGNVLKNACSAERTFSIRNYGIGTLIVDPNVRLIAGFTDAWIVSELSESPQGDGRLGEYEDTGDQITFTVQFCPLGFVGILQPGTLEIMSNDSAHPTTTVNMIGMGVDCPDGYYDLDENPYDCEYHCLTPEEDLFPIEKCDNYDNDCNGFIDEDFGLGDSCVALGACGKYPNGATFQGFLECDPIQDYGVRCSTMPGGSQNGETAYSPFDWCDNVDNNCNGEKDEEFPVGQTCLAEGACGIGNLECDSEVTVRCSSDIGGSDYPDPPPLEICNYVDDDCDGFTDNGTFYINNTGDPPQICENCLGVVCSGAGACGWGVYECALNIAGGAWVRCCSDPGGSCVDSRPEICNGLDDDCDGEPDNGYNIGDPCFGDGECSKIIDAVLQCDPNDDHDTICSSNIGGDDYPFWVETCNKKDDDCDGNTDEDFNVGAPCLGRGECAQFPGELECNPAFGQPDEPITICSTDPNGSDPRDIPELCDGKDNDCDGLTDEDYSVGPTFACVGEGECPVGVWECDGFYDRVCSTNPGGTQYIYVPESCDGRDNNCNGSIDENYFIGVPCDGEGACGMGTNVCKGTDDYICSTEPGGPDNEATYETCNGEDDDCDSFTDEDFLIGQACQGTGECGAGVWQCNDCFGDPVPPDEPPHPPKVCSTDPCGSQFPNQPEICDSKDNDCDGKIDEDFVLCGDDASIERCGACNNACNLNGKHAVPYCNEYASNSCRCEIYECSNHWFDTNGQYGDGCECQSDSYDMSSATAGDSCGDATRTTPYTLTDNDPSSRRAVVYGNLAEVGDEDWFTFAAVDGGESGPSYCDNFHVYIQLTSNPSGEVALDVFEGNCDSQVCGGTNRYKWATDSTWQSGTDPSGVKGQCPCNPNSVPGVNVCTTENKVYWVKVYRNTGASQCAAYTLEVTNGHYSSR